jgi:hypothetical protein
MAVNMLPRCGGWSRTILPAEKISLEAGQTLLPTGCRDYQENHGRKKYTQVVMFVYSYLRTTE